MTARRASKAKAQKFHAHRRCEQRYGFSLDHLEVVRKIQEGDGLILQRQSNRVSIWLLHLSDKFVPVVYDRERKTVATVLPFEWVKSLGTVHEKRAADWMAQQVAP